MARALDVSRDTFWRWQSEHPDFSDAVTRATDLALAWFEEAGRNGLFLKTFNANLYSLIIRNRWPDLYSDRKDHNVSGNLGVQLIQIETEVCDPPEREVETTH